MNSYSSTRKNSLLCKPELWICLFLILSISMVYAEVITYDFIGLDDDVYVFENPSVRSGLNLKSIIAAFTTTPGGLWIPLTRLSLMLDYELYSLEAGGYHLTNILLHMANCLLLFWCLKKMTSCRWQSAFVAALLALHPMHVESVAWITERKDVLSMFFWMLTMLGYLRYVAKPAARRYLVMLLFFVLGLMAKPMLVTLPCALLLLDFWPLKRYRYLLQGDNKTDRRSPVSALSVLIREKLPLFAIAAVAGSVTFVVQQRFGATADIDSISYPCRVYNALVSYVGYIGKMVWPRDLAVLYPHPGDSLPVSQIVLAGALLAAISVVVIFLRHKYAYLPAGWFWYLVTLLPVIGLVQTGPQAMADRFAYVPFIGLYILIAWGVPDMFAGFDYGKRLLGPLAAAVLVVLLVTARHQASYWQNSITLFEHTLAVTENNHAIHTNLGVAFAEQDNIEEALRHFNKALHISPRNAKARFNLGIVLAGQGQAEQAISHFTRVLQVWPDDAQVHYQLGNLLAKSGATAQAAGHYAEALRIQPCFAEVHNNLGLLVAGQGRADEAVNHFRTALACKPAYADAHYNLGVVLAGQGNTTRAIHQYTRALQEDPGYAKAHYNLGIVYLKQNSLPEAAACFQEAVGSDPDYAQAHYNLGAVLARMGNTPQAVMHLQEALRIRPGYARARAGLDKLLAGRTDKSMMSDTAP